VTVQPSVITTGRPSEPKDAGAAVPVDSVGSATALMDALTDECSRKIVSSTVSVGRTVEEICSDQRIPVSTCYRKVKQLVSQGVLTVERKVATGKGKGHAVYRSVFSSLRVEMKDGEVSVYVLANPVVAERLGHQGQVTRLKEG
jgi:hypothetical protein